eukprot:6154363-Heterocapsa_arctica.AAC.1
MVGVGIARSPKRYASEEVAIIFEKHWHVSAKYPMEQGREKQAGEKWITTSPAGVENAVLGQLGTDCRLSGRPF